MHRIGFAVCGILLLTGCASQSAITTNTWHEVVISVSDLDASAEFLQRHTGYAEQWRGRLEASELSTWGLDRFDNSGEALLLAHDIDAGGLIRLIRFDPRPADGSIALPAVAAACGQQLEVPLAAQDAANSVAGTRGSSGPDGLMVLPAGAASGAIGITQTVASLDDALRFYADIIGLDSQRESTSTALVHSGGKSGHYLRLKEDGNESQPAQAAHEDSCIAPNTGVLALRFRVGNANNAESFVSFRGAEIYRETRQTEMFPYGELRLFTVKTPDGVNLQFYEVIPRRLLR